jgi:hypothetical protein
LKEVEAWAKHGRGTETCVDTVKPPEFSGTTSWAVFQHQFKTIAEHTCWTRLEKSTHLVTTSQGHATNVLHGVPKGVTHEETLEALEDHFGDQHLAAVYHSKK